MIEHYNAYEVENLRFTVSNHITHVPHIHSVTDLSLKSIGHCLSSLLMAFKCGHTDTSTAHKLIHTFFTQYLTVRQLHDDAHDWYSDLFSGRFSYVNTHVLKCASVHIPVLLHEIPKETLYNAFNTHTFPHVIQVIQEHIELAFQALQELEHRGVISYSPFFHSLLSSFAISYASTMQEQAKIHEFICCFQNRQSNLPCNEQQSF